MERVFEIANCRQVLVILLVAKIVKGLTQKSQLKAPCVSPDSLYQKPSFQDGVKDPFF